MSGELDRPRILFRCDASAGTGGGHVMRCLTLAGSLAAHGAAISFACSRETPETVPALGASGYELILTDDPLDHASLTGRERRWDAAVIDHYQIDAHYERNLHRVAPVIAVIDDLADRSHDCDILLDQTVGRAQSDYAGVVPLGAQLCLGPQFALLRPEFARARPAALAARINGGPVRRIFVSLGMTDIGGATAKAVRAGLEADLDAEIAVAVGSRAESLPELQGLAAGDSRVRLHLASPDTCALMAKSDLAIGAAGTTSWERCCLGLPTVMLVLAENQSLIARNLADLGAARLIADGQLAALAATIRDLAENPAARIAMSETAARVCDGEGARRVAKLIVETLCAAQMGWQ